MGSLVFILKHIQNSISAIYRLKRTMSDTVWKLHFSDFVFLTRQKTYIIPCKIDMNFKSLINFFSSNFVGAGIHVAIRWNNLIFINYNSVMSSICAERVWLVVNFIASVKIGKI